MAKHKKQHVIPKCYLKAWVDPSSPKNQEPYVWVFGKEERDGRRKAPRNIFHENDFYTVGMAEGDRNLTVEHGLSEIESRFAGIRIRRLNFSQELPDEERFTLCLFVAALHMRTPAQLDHLTGFWERVLKMMNQMKESLDKASPEKRAQMVRASSLGSSSGKGASMEQVQAAVDERVKHIMVPALITEAKLLPTLDMAILQTDSELGFITSDSPVVWFDPEAYKRPPMHQVPALMYETIEITMPISPSQMLLLNRGGQSGYVEVAQETVDELNRRTRFHAHANFVVRKDATKDVWFKEGEESEDAWEKLHGNRKDDEPPK